MYELACCANQVSLNPVVLLTCLMICKMMQFGTTTVNKRYCQGVVETKSEGEGGDYK